MDAEIGLETLKSLWSEIQSIPYQQAHKGFVEDDDLKKIIKQLVNSSTKAFRYALMTQVLAKIVDPRVNCLAIQVQARVPYAFDARSFCKATVVPFEREYLDNILGGSGDPYVGKPLRHEKITLDIIDHIKNKEEWRNLHLVLSLVQHKGKEFALAVLKQILLDIRDLLLQQPTIPPNIPSVSVEKLKEILASYLGKPSQGLRPQAIVYALFKVFNEKTKTFGDVSSAKVTVADTPAGRLADIECRDMEGNIKLAVCVTEDLNSEKLCQELEKAKANGVKNVLIIGCKISLNNQEIEQLLGKYNLEVATSLLVDFIVTMTVLLNSEMRRNVVLKMYEVLQELEGLDHLREWDKIVREKLELTI